MAKDKSFHDYVVFDLMGDIPGISSRAMFGGWAVYRDGVIFGIIVGQELYFKVDDKNRSVFEEMGSHPFVYSKKDGKTATMSYWLVGEEIIEDRDKICQLMEGSIAAGGKE